MEESMNLEEGYHISPKLLQPCLIEDEQFEVHLEEEEKIVFDSNKKGAWIDVRVVGIRPL